MGAVSGRLRQLTVAAGLVMLAGAVLQVPAGPVTARATVLPMTFSVGGTDLVGRLRHGTRELAITWPKKLPKPEQIWGMGAGALRAPIDDVSLNNGAHRHLLDVGDEVGFDGERHVAVWVENGQVTSVHAEVPKK